MPVGSHSSRMATRRPQAPSRAPCPPTHHAWFGASTPAGRGSRPCSIWTEQCVAPHTGGRAGTVLGASRPWVRVTRWAIEPESPLPAHLPGRAVPRSRNRATLTWSGTDWVGAPAPISNLACDRPRSAVSYGASTGWATSRLLLGHCWTLRSFVQVIQMASPDRLRDWLGWKCVGLRGVEQPVQHQCGFPRPTVGEMRSRSPA